MEDCQIRTADSIFSDRINLWNRLGELEKDVDGSKAAPIDLLEEIVLKSIRMEQCFAELKKLNDTGHFIGKHPFISQQSERERVTELLKSNPDAYFQERKNIDLNITRYTSQLNSKKLGQEKKVLAAENLERYKALLTMYKEILNEVVNL
ncbi:MAG: hypothetical protein ACI3ZQ_04945 [Candidatus Cryptobacteroides sp.]